MFRRHDRSVVSASTSLAFGTALSLAALAFPAWAQDSGDADAVSEEPAPPASCVSADPDRSLRLLDRELRDTPALTAAPLRKLNAQLSRGECFSAASTAVDALLIGGDESPGAYYLEARVDALAGRRNVAERKADAALGRAPGYAPLLVLKASLLLDREQRAPARELLAQADAAQPGDLRSAFQRMRVDALDAPKGDGARQLFKVLRDTSMPPDIRDVAMQTLLYLTALDIDKKQDAVREGLRFESQTSRADKLNTLARLLAEESGKTEAARKLLQQVLDDKQVGQQSQHMAEVLMAETWLLDAARIDPMPSARNAELVAKARAAANDDMVPLAGRIRGLHDLSALLPFVADVHDANERGPDGLTLVCRGAQLLDESKIRRALEAGAEVDSECSGSTALAYVVRQGPGFFSIKRDILALLLAAGANPDPKLYPGSSYTAMSFCAESLPGCAEALLPTLKEYAKPAAATPSAPTVTQ